MRYIYIIFLSRKTWKRNFFPASAIIPCMEGKARKGDGWRFTAW